jgi:hypothetical protein
MDLQKKENVFDLEKRRKRSHIIDEDICLSCCNGAYLFHGHAGPLSTDLYNQAVMYVVASSIIGL